MDIGTEKEPYIVEPVEDPFSRPEPMPERAPAKPSEIPDPTPAKPEEVPVGTWTTC